MTRFTILLTINSLEVDHRVLEVDSKVKLVGNKRVGGVVVGKAHDTVFYEAYKTATKELTVVPNLV